MKKYIYFTEEKNVWLDLAIMLKANNIAEPVICILDEMQKDRYKNIFKNCHLLDYSKSNLGFFEDKASDDIAGIHKIIQHKDFFLFKDQVIKMMDRQDLFGGYRNIDRNDLFYSILFYFIDLIQKEKPDFLLMIGTPHMVSTFIIYNICAFLDIKSYSFYKVTILPILLLREGLDGKYIRINGKIKDDISLNLEEDITKFLNKFKENQFTDPDDIKIQKNNDSFSIKNSYRKIMKYFSLFFYRKVDYYTFSSFKDSISIFDKFLFFILKRKIIAANIRSLNNSITHDIDLEKEFVYFPIHYQPERTTSPDGGEYYDQIKAILKVREIVPKHIPIYIKEHYSQFTNTLQGYRGKGRFFYPTIKQIPNVHIIQSDIQSNLLIKKSLFVVSITGTALTESVCFGKPALMLGLAWFENFRGITKISNEVDLNMILSNIGSIDTFREDIFGLIKDYGTFGSIGPRYSYTNNFYNDQSEYEVHTLYKNIVPILLAK